MKILFHIAHPAQYHMYKFTIHNLNEQGHRVNVTINTKDILEELLINDGVSYKNILPIRRKKNTKWAALLTLLKKDFKLFFIQLKENYDLMVGTETALSHVGWLLRKPVLIMDEDDVHVVPEAAALSFPFASYVVSPVSCDLGKWTKKKISYSGYQKTCYLHPNYFKPRREFVSDIIDTHGKYYLIRVSGLSAYHDSGSNGFNLDVLRSIVVRLAPHGKVLISTEKALPPDLNKYLFKADVSRMHHLLSYAEILIADSQSMCVEAALLGTPSLRYSDFAGRIGVLEELEHKYGLTYGFKVSDYKQMYTKLDELLATKNLKLSWEVKKNAMLKEKIDVTAFWTWLIGNYPNSIKTLKKDPDYQYSFK